MAGYESQRTRSSGIDSLDGKRAGIGKDSEL
jgi:hypothetical protein